MKKAGIFFVAMSLLIVFLAFNMDVVVGKTYNIGLLNERQNIVYLSGILFLSGIMLFGFGFVAKEEAKNIKGFVLWTILTPVVLLIGMKVVTDIQEANRQEEIRVKEAAEQEEIRLRIAREKDGVVILKKGLMWQRCTVGQTWTGAICDGNPTKIDWDAAMNLTSSFAGYNDWRLPTKDELMTLVYCSDGEYKEDGSCINYRNVVKPTINATYFPNAQSDALWSSSRLRRDLLWIVYFDYGFSSEDFNSNSHYVRLVRG